MKESVWVFSVQVPTILYDELVTYMTTWPIEGIWEDDGCIKLFVDEARVHHVRASLDDLGEAVSYKTATSPDINWNAAWEAAFDPVYIDRFCLIYAPFHTIVSDATYCICMQPKMAFGTGHHETTYMMIKMMSAMDLKDKAVCDIGCGTSVLSILAEKMGAKHISAIDNEKPAIDNSQYNIELNDCNKIEIIYGSLEQLKSDKFDIILANINYNVLMEAASSLVDLVKDDETQLVISGILTVQADHIIERYQKLGWTMVKQMKRGAWSCMLFNGNMEKRMTV